MYHLALSTSLEHKGDLIGSSVVQRGLRTLGRYTGVDMDKALAFQPDRQVGHGDDWVLYREPPFNETVEPDPAVVLVWVKEAVRDALRSEALSH
jgi:hypothetical protein